MISRDFPNTGATDGERLAGIDLILNDHIDAVTAALRGAVGRGDLAAVCELADELKTCAEAIVERCGEDEGPTGAPSTSA